MKSVGVIAVAGLALVLSLGGCGQPKPASGPSSEASPASRPANHSPIWNGNGTLGRLSKLGNYSYRSSLSVGVGGNPGKAIVMEGDYHNPTQYKLVVNGGKSSLITLIAADNGHYYYQDGATSYDVGTKPDSFFKGFSSAGASAWGGLWTGTRGTYVGPCNVAGRAGNSFRLVDNTSVIYAGIFQSVSGTACVDAVTGAPLSSEFQFALKSNKGSTTYKDSLVVTGVGNVPPVTPPAGAQPLPKIP